MKILTILGARLQFIKADSVSRENFKYKEIEEFIVHTGIELLENAFNTLVGVYNIKILDAYQNMKAFQGKDLNLYGGGKVSEVTIRELKNA